MSMKASQNHSTEIGIFFVKIVLLVSTCRILMLKRQNKNRNHTAAFIEKFNIFFRNCFLKEKKQFAFLVALKGSLSPSNPSIYHINSLGSFTVRCPETGDNGDCTQSLTAGTPSSLFLLRDWKDGQ